MKLNIEFEYADINELLLKQIFVAKEVYFYAYTSELVKIMEEYQLPITQNMARREQLREQLHQDNYAELDLTCHTENDCM